MIINTIDGILDNNIDNKVHIIRTFGDYNEQLLMDFLNGSKSKHKNNYQKYDSDTIEEENKKLFKALLFNNGVDADIFTGTIEIFEFC